MKALLLVIVIIAILMAMVIYAFVSSWRCPICGSKMYQYYDEERDALVWKCPKCNRTFYVNG